LAGALPNAVVEASGAQGVAGRLRIRTREQTVTFRGVARIVEVVPASLRVTLEIEAVFGRAGGTVEGIVEIALRQSGTGTRVVVGGRLAIAPGTTRLSAESLDAAMSRLVQRWFTALAETSPAGRGEQAQDGLPPTAPRSNERASLAVVRDVRGAGDEETQEDSAGPFAMPRAATPEGPQSVERPERKRPAGSDSDARAAAVEEPPPATLRLVAPPRDEPADANAGSGTGSAGPGPDSATEPWGPAEPEDIWSRQREGGLPSWIVFLVGAGTAALAALMLLLAALRRRRRR
jgi:carbon monoxide dehydrogenase subunit G